MNPRIIFEAPAGESFGPARELLCSVWPLGKNNEQISIGEPTFSNHMVLVGPHQAGDEASVLELPKPGAYLIEVGYPNGMSLRTTASIGDGEQYRLIVQNPGSVLPSSSAPRSTVGLVPRVLSATLKGIHLKAPDIEVRMVMQSHVRSLQDLRSLASDLRDLATAADCLARIPNADLSFSMPLPGARVIDFRESYQRRWLVVEGNGRHHTMVAYPFGWRKQGDDAFSLAMRRRAIKGAEATKWSVALRLTDPVYGSLIEYLTRQDVQSASDVSGSLRGQATMLLYEKENNPFAAAAAAYLFALGRGDLEQRREWMLNLSNWYGWMPDGAIALAWKLLREGRRGSNSWIEARKLLLLACQRGLPYYTVGLHILVEALTVLSFADPDDTAIRSALADARAADVACLRGEPFTTLQVSRYLGLPTQ